MHVPRLARVTSQFQSGFLLSIDELTATVTATPPGASLYVCYPPSLSALQITVRQTGADSGSNSIYSSGIGDNAKFNTSIEESG